MALTINLNIRFIDSHLSTEGEKTIMATLADITAALDTLQADTDAKNAQVTSDLAALAKQITDLQAQIAAGGSVTPADLDSVLAKITGIDDKVKAIDPAASPAA
jgi:flagellar hook-associated protein FlgK